MNQKTKSPKFLKQRRFFTILPVLILPFTTLLFWSLDGGKGNQANAAEVKPEGLINTLPGAQPISDQPTDKMSFYEHAASDSAKMRNLMKNDPYYREEVNMPAIPGQGQLNTSTYSPGGFKDPNEEKVYRKLDQLNAVLNQPPTTSGISSTVERSGIPLEGNGVSSKDIDRLQTMMQTMQQSQGEDPEMKQLNTMLERIIDIQHPERLKEKNFAKAKSTVESLYHAVPAIVSENQKVSEGTVIKLRLLDSMTVNEIKIPRGHEVFGICEMNNQRLILRIKNIRLGYSILPVDLTVFDMVDGMEGINAPEAITGDAIRSGSDNALQGIQILPMDQTVGTQIAEAGVSAAKGLFSKKIRRVKAKIKAGYPVLLRNNQQK